MDNVRKSCKLSDPILEYIPRRSHFVYRCSFGSTFLIAFFHNIVQSAKRYDAFPSSKDVWCFNIFGLPGDETFEKTCNAFVKVSNATEHHLLAYIRDMSTMEPLPTRLADHVRGYPSMLSSNPTRPGRGVRGVPFTLVSKSVRLYSVGRAVKWISLANHMIGKLVWDGEKVLKKNFKSQTCIEN